MIRTESRSLLFEALVAAACLVVLTVLCWIIFTSTVYQAKWGIIWANRLLFLKGFGLTMFASLMGLLLAMIFAVLLVGGQKVGSEVLKRVCQGYIELIRGTPLLVQIVVAYFVIASPFGLDKILPPFVSEPLLVGTIALAGFSAAYLAEILRGGIGSIADSQLEAATAVGFTNAQTYRYVIVPQAVRRTLPGVAGEFANLIKNSSLLSVIGVGEIFKQSQDVNALHYVSFESYVPLAIGYLLLTIPIALVSRELEKRYAFQS